MPDEPVDEIKPDVEPDGANGGESSFHTEIIPRVEAYLGKSLVRKSGLLWSSSDDSILIRVRRLKGTRVSAGLLVRLVSNEQRGAEWHANPTAHLGLEVLASFF